MHQRFIKRAEGMAAARVPNTSAGRIALMGQPDVGLKIVQFIIADNILGIAYDF